LYFVRCKVVIVFVRFSCARFNGRAVIFESAVTM
jgi:hypothetical protein